MVIVLLDKVSYKFKNHLKRYITELSGLPSQFVFSDTIWKKKKNFTTILSKLVLQIFSKLGWKIWQVDLKGVIPNYYIPAVAGLSVYKEKSKFNFRLVGSLNPHSNKYSPLHQKSSFKPEEKFKCMTKMFEVWIKKYMEDSEKNPNLIVVYRDGLTLEQVKAQVKEEILALKTAVSHFKDYRPEIVYMIVCNKENTRFYMEVCENSLINCHFGTAYIDSKINDQAYEFYLQAHSVSRACAQPVFYRVALNESELTQKELISFTNSQCYNYYNWTGATKIPACLQYNKKLTKFIQETSLDINNLPKLEGTPHFL